MSICYKYSFYSNVVLTTFFYMSLFPLGTVFSFVGLLLSYFLEIVHLGFYKRPEILNSRLCKCFVYNFKFAMAVFAIGNYVFLHDVDKHCDINWSLINLILFIVIAFIPYDSIKFNLLGIKEGEITEGSYDKYELMFPTDYEKQNPLTKNKAMIKYFERLRNENLIDNIERDYLINRIKKEPGMVNYYKISKNVGTILGYYEFQSQFAKLKKKHKLIKEIKKKNKNNSAYDIYIKQKAQERRQKINMLNNLNPSKRNDTEIITSNNINNQNNNFDDYNNPKLKRKISDYMKKAILKNMRNEGIYSETDDENIDDNIKNEENSDESS